MKQLPADIFIIKMANKFGVGTTQLEKAAKQIAIKESKHLRNESKRFNKIINQELKYKAYYQTPEHKARQKAKRQTPEHKARQKAYRQTPEVKARYKAYRQTPEHKARQKAYRQTPEGKARYKVYSRTYYLKHKR